MKDINSNQILNDDEIRFLSPRDACRLRPGMYIGSTGEKHGGSTIYREILDNSMDVISEGYGTTILTSANFNGFCFVADDGKGLPITMSVDKPNITSAELSISEFHSGSKFGGTENLARIGLNGVGSSAANFCSSVYIILSKITSENYDKSIPAVKKCWNDAGPRSKGNLFYILVMNEGLKVYEGAGKLKDLEKMIFKGIKGYISLPENQSTIVLFKPDPKIFDDPTAEVPVTNLQYFLLIQEKFYKRKVNVIVDGVSLRNTFNPYKFEILKTIIPADTSFNKQVAVYVTFETDDKLANSESFGSVNGLNCNEGMHINLFKNLYKTSLKDYFKIKHDYLLNGLRFCIVILANECQFNSQTKETLKQITKVKPVDFLPIVKEIEKVFKKNQDYWDLHVHKLEQLAESMKSIGAIEKAQKIIDAASGNGIYRAKGDMKKGFADATAPINDRWNCELFITEGDSPAGSLKAARKAIDVKYRAILPLRGKVLDVSDCNADKMMENEEFFTIFSAMGLGLDARSVINENIKTPQEAFEVIKKKARYGKLVVATDSDEDGLSIQKGILYCILKFARFMIDFGLVYVCESPIFDQGGKYYYPSEPRIPGTQFCVGMDPSKPYRRFKGLGSLNRSDVYKSFFDLNTRRMIRVTPEYAQRAMELVENVEKRKELLYSKGILTNPYNFNDL